MPTSARSPVPAPSGGRVWAPAPTKQRRGHYDRRFDSGQCTGHPYYRQRQRDAGGKAGLTPAVPLHWYHYRRQRRRDLLRPGRGHQGRGGGGGVRPLPLRGCGQRLHQAGRRGHRHPGRAQPGGGAIRPAGLRRVYGQRSGLPLGQRGRLHRLFCPHRLPHGHLSVQDGGRAGG